MSDDGPKPEGTAREQELLREIAALRARVAELEGQGRVPPPPPAPPPPALDAPRSTPPVTPPDFVPSREELGASRPALSAEQFIGRRVVPFVGAIAVLGAIGFLVHYAIEIGLIGKIPPEARFAIGVLLGLGLLAAGEAVRRRGAPGAAMGLDAAGVGAEMVSVALGVFSLQIFSPAAGAVLALAAGVLASIWSVRSGSVAVAVSAIIGCFAMPAGVGLVRSDPRLAGLLLALALSIGLAVHLIGGARFALARWIGVGAAAMMGIPVLVTISSPVEAFSFALCWWGLVIGQATLAAQRGIDARSNAVIALSASAALVFVEVGAWPAGMGFLGLTVIKFLPPLAGGVCLAISLMLLPMAAEPKDAEEASALGQSGAAIAVACRMLAHTLLALAIALGVGGSAFLLASEMKPIAVVAAAAALTWGGQRLASSAFDLLSAITGWIACVVGIVVLLSQAGGGQSWSVPLSTGAAVDVRWSLAHLTLALTTGVAFAMTTAARNRVVAALLAFPAMFSWIAVSLATLDGLLAGALLVLPALVIAWLPRAKAATVIVATVLAGLGGAVIVGRALLMPVWSAPSGMEQLVVALSVWCTAIVLLAHRRPVGVARAVAVRIAVVLTGAAVTFVCAVGGVREGYDGLDAGFSLSIGLALSALIAAFVGRLVRASEILDGAALLAASAVGVCGVLGVTRVLERVPYDESVVGLEIAAIASSACAAVFIMMGRPASSGETPIARAMPAFAAFTAGPSVVLLLSALFGRPMSPPVAVGALVLIGVGELLVGFRREMPALRWAALACFGLLVLRLYAVDLADAPMLVRIGLLFVSGMVLVATGIAYARVSRRSE